MEKVFHKNGLKDKLNADKGVERYFLFMSQKNQTLSRIFKNGFKQDATKEFLQRHYPENKFKDKSKYLMYLDFATWLVDESLLRTDKMTMSFGLEQRVPILDDRLIELGFRIPTKYKVRGKANNKWIFRQAMKEFLPEHVLNQTKKGWFSPYSKWLRSDLKEMAGDVLSPKFCPQTVEYFNFDEINKMLGAHFSGKVSFADTIWSLLCCSNLV